LSYYDKGIKNQTPGSHEGLLYYDPKRGWMVTHNIKGRKKEEPASKLMGDTNLYGIIGIADAGKIKDKSIPEMKKEEEEKRARSNFF